MDSYQEKIFKAIRKARPDLGEIVRLDSVKYLSYSAELYPAVVSAARNLDFDSIPEPVFNKGEFHEYLDIQFFQTKVGDKFIVTIYDSDELEQDPEVLDIWKCESL